MVIYFLKQGMFSKINSFRHYVDTIMESCVKYSCSAEFVKQLVAKEFSALSSRQGTSHYCRTVANGSFYLADYKWNVLPKFLYYTAVRTQCLLFVYLVQRTGNPSQMKGDTRVEKFIT